MFPYFGRGVQTGESTNQDKQRKAEEAKAATEREAENAELLKELAVQHAFIARADALIARAYEGEKGKKSTVQDFLKAKDTYAKLLASYIRLYKESESPVGKARQQKLIDADKLALKELKTQLNELRYKFGDPVTE